MAKKIISIVLAVPALALAVTVNPAIWYLSLAGLVILTALAYWNLGGGYEIN